jgi:hypothetical protein
MKMTFVLWGLILITNSIAHSQVEPMPVLTRADIHVVGSDTGPGHAPFLFFSYKVPNGAIGNCVENNGLGEYSTKKATFDDSHHVRFVCTVPLIQVAELHAGLGFDPNENISLTNEFFASYSWEPRRIPPKDKLHEIDEIGELRRKNIALFEELHKSYRPSIAHLYENAANFWPGILGTRIEFYCFPYQGLPDVDIACSPEKLRALARRISFDPSKGKFLKAVGLLPM